MYTFLFSQKERYFVQRERRADAAKRPIGFGNKFRVLVNGNNWVKESVKGH